MNTRGTSYTIVTLALCVFCLFVFFHDRLAIHRAQVNIENHARILSEALWNYDDQFAEQYVQLACRTEDYDLVVIHDASGRVFLKVEGPSPARFEALLVSVGLIRVIHLGANMQRNQMVIGHLQADWYCKNIYLYSYSFFALMLALAVFLMYLRVTQINQTLERRVKIRTGELEQSNISLQQEVIERLNAEKALKQSHETFETVMDSLDATIYVSDLETDEILFMNRQSREIYGDAPEGSHCFQVFGRNPARCPYCRNDRLVDEDGRPTGTLVWEGRNAATGGWNMNYDRAIQWVDGRLVHLQIAIDISRFKELEQERLEAEAKFQQAQKLEALGTLAGGIAHDFNNLLMGMLGNISLLMMDTDPQGEEHRKLSRIEKQILSGSRLTSQLLGYARKGKYEIRPLDINQIVIDSLATFGRTRKEINIHRTLSGEPLYVEADPGQMEQVLLNILINAADAMPEGGDLYITTSTVPYTFLAGKPFAPDGGRYALLQIKDTGMGMDEEVLKRIFEPFFTTKDMGRGTGLGLASAYGIVKSHNGYIDVDSLPGEGSIFNVLLPLIEKLGRTASPGIILPEGDATAPSDAVEGGTILLVDDEPMIMDVCSGLLTHLGYEVMVATSGREALNTFRENKEKINLVLLDMVMPDMSGSDVFDELLNIDPAVKVLLSSGYSIDGKARKILDRGCRGFIQKPYTLNALSKKLKEILRT